MARQDLSNEQQKTRRLIRPGYFNVWAYSSAENAVKQLNTLMHPNPLVAFFEPVIITLGPVSAGRASYSAPNSSSTSAPKPASSLLRSAKNLGINDPLGD